MPKQAANCPAEMTLSIIAGKWKPAILWILRKGPQRSGKIKSRLPGITAAAFSNAVHDLEEAGMIKRRAKPTLPPEVSYEITPRGESLRPILRSVIRWGFDHQSDFGTGSYAMAGLYEE